jgi:hypothetical protein
MIRINEEVACCATHKRDQQPPASDQIPDMNYEFDYVAK